MYNIYCSWHKYMSNNSNVYSCLLDDSKAFAKTHLGNLFNILLNRKVVLVSLLGLSREE